MTSFERRYSTEDDTILVLPKKFSVRIFRVCFLTLGSTGTAASFGLIDCTLLTTAVFVTSINYWRLPTRSWRRSADMITVAISCIYQSLHALTCSTRLWYFALIFLGVVCYFKARRSRNLNYASAWHCGIHICANIANVSLYIGLSEE